MEGYYVGNEKVPQKEYKTVMTSNPSWDASKPGSFGFQQLAKMGWKEGKGLGKKEDGDTEAVKIRKKVDSRGLGREEGVVSGGVGEWSSVLFNFDQVLQRLNSSGSKVDNNQQKPDQKSKDSDNQRSLPRRPIYKKMMTAKSVSKYSSDDLNAILGNIASKKATEGPDEPKQTPKKPIEIPKEQAETVHDSHDQEFGFQTHVSQVSISDYFKKKMESLNQNHSLEKDRDDEDSCDPASLQKEQGDESNTDDSSSKKGTKTKRNKAKTKKKTQEQECDSDEIKNAVGKRQRSDDETPEEDVEKKVTSEKRKKKRKEKIKNQN